jgi:POT family proton-dependent oligopeptide transporter
MVRSGLKHVKHADIIKPAHEGDMPIGKIVSSVFLPALAAGVIGWFIPGNILGSDSNDAFIFACIPIIIFYFSLWYRAKGFERKRISTLLIFWCFHYFLEYLQSKFYSPNDLGANLYRS